MTRIRRVDTQKEMDRQTNELVLRGYKIVSEADESTKLKEKDWGDSSTHFIIAILTIWWTLGFANLIYAIYSRVTADEVLIKIDNEFEQ